jgi:hypothetical protein
VSARRHLALVSSRAAAPVDPPVSREPFDMLQQRVKASPSTTREIAALRWTLFGVCLTTMLCLFFYMVVPVVIHFAAWVGLLVALVTIPRRDA